MKQVGEKWCRFSAGEHVFYGRLEGDELVEISGFPWDDARVETGVRHALASVSLLPPVLPTTFYCVGLNYRQHVIDMARQRGAEPKFPSRPEVGYRSNSGLCAHGDAIIKPHGSGDLFQYEGELVVVIGRGGRHIAEVDALDHVFGWTIGNDVSEREWQRGDRTNWRAKNSDTFSPMGPWIATGIDYRRLTTVVRLNGEEVERFPTGEMVFPVEAYIAEISRYCTLHPGDVIWMGTDGEPRNLKPGDVCEIDIDGIGVLKNPIIAEA